MPYEFTESDVAYLRSDAGRDAVRSVAGLELSASSRIADVARARSLAGERSGAVLETARLQRDAATKLPGRDGWLLSADALQQASAEPVSRHRAARFGQRRVHDVTCSIGADLAAAPVGSVGSDVDPVRLAMAAANCPGVPLLRADALRPVSRGCAVFADPARRDRAGRRRWRSADLQPPLDEMIDAYRGRDLAVKCAPGLDFVTAPRDCEIEVTSLDRQAREACIWTGTLATPGIRRRATVLSTGGPEWTVTGADPDDCPVTEVQEWLVDPDPAVVRAGLVRQYATRHGLAQLDERIAYLTGPRPPQGIRAFAVTEALRYTEKNLRAALARAGIGRVEILTRGVPVDPNALRPRLKLRGSGECSVVITRVGAEPVAFLCTSGYSPVHVER